MATVVYVMPVDAPAERQQRVRDYLESLAHAGTSVRVVAFPGGPSDLEYHCREHRAVTWMLEQLPEVVSGAHAVCVGCFYDPGIRELRETLDVPVIGIAEASFQVASAVAHNFSVLVGRRKWIPKMSDNALLYGFAHRISSWRVVEVSVAELHAHPDSAYSAVLEAARRAVEDDRAEALVLGCAAMEGMAARLQDALGVPVIDPVVAGFKVAEMLGHLYEKVRLGTSKVGDYTCPQQHTIAQRAGARCGKAGGIYAST
ncbi:MAG: aspartate/glutamate racemase family protein [Bacillota bacterium]